MFFVAEAPRSGPPMSDSSYDQLDLPLQMPRPRAEHKRHILLGARIVTYTFVRSRRRTLGMTVDQRGLRVGAPHAARLCDAEDFIRSNRDWVLRKLDEWRPASRPRRILICHGARLPLFGSEWTLRVTPGRDRVRWHEDELELEVCEATEPRELLLRSLKARALALFRERAARFARSLDRSLPPLALSNAQTRWGSCSHKTGLRLNWRLIHLPLHLIDYVIAHELAHLAEMNHSRRFWQVVEGLYPDYRRAREELKTHALVIPQF
jgi:predicted metal-dependent hydrolase